MQKYEILMILDPKAEASVATELVSGIFGKENIKKSEQLERTDLAYAINGSKKGIYMLFEVESASELIAEFTRRCNILKTVWRQIVINLDNEKKMLSEKKSKKYERKSFTKKVEESTNSEVKPRKRVVKKEAEETSK
ncbi:30S ribosomal protein S6 [Mycoplasmopsis opalescens]|uniref:30S ribosomal protein S6 n=1 Tax=Mycoplasmopsis opalescens TaxID=114886 RepID=UPI0004A756E3|nr:30S ribosomal protein S6 [Mycoplasmopsis opalescens]